MIAQIHHISVHPLKTHQGEGTAAAGETEIQTLLNVQVHSSFGILLDDFSRKLVEQLDASFEYDGSIALFLNGEAISGQLSADGESLARVEIHQCESRQNLKTLLSLLDDEHEQVIQVMELGVFCTVDQYLKLLEKD